MNQSLGGPFILCRNFVEYKKFLLLLGIEHRILSCRSCSLVMIPTELPKHTVDPHNTRSGEAENKLKNSCGGGTKKSPNWFIYSRRRLKLGGNSVFPEEISKSIPTLKLQDLASRGERLLWLSGAPSVCSDVKRSCIILSYLVLWGESFVNYRSTSHINTTEF